MLPVRTKLVLHSCASSLLVVGLSAATSHVVDSPTFRYLVGAAVGYRLVMLVLVGRNFLTAIVAVPADVVE
jgi:hypothetical protein